MAATAVVDTGFLVALLRDRDIYRDWANVTGADYPFPWHTCESVLSETFHILPLHAAPVLFSLIERQVLLISFDFAQNQHSVLKLMRKYADLPMDLADASLVRMTELLEDPVVLTTDNHFRVYRRNSRHVVPCVLPY